MEQFQLSLNDFLKLQYSNEGSNGNRFQSPVPLELFQFGTLAILTILSLICIEEYSIGAATASIWNPMFSHNYRLLEREFNETTLLLTGALDTDERNQMTQRLLTIILEGRELAKILEYPAPKWFPAAE